MKQSEPKLTSLLSLLRNKINLFYLLALAPLMIVFYFSPFSAIIPFYGFLLLLIKQQKMVALEEANFIQKILGSIVLVSSFFVYYGVVFVYPGAAFYTPANYAVYLLGLFLVFFRFSALKEAFAPLFLIVAATSSTFVADWLKPFLSPFANDFARAVVAILRVMGINASIYYSDYASVVTFVSLSGKLVAGAFVYECIGVYSALVFSVILAVFLFEVADSVRVKLAYAVVGLLGTFAMNLLRVTMIFVTDYFYGAEAGATTHFVAGYALFSTWLAIFFLIYAKRQTLHTKVILFWKKTH
jgi:exosortase/archaeosortase family protein